MNREKRVELLIGQLIKGSKFENKTFSVGGFVRDEIMGIESKDLDIVVNIDGGAKGIAEFLHAKMPSATTSPHNMGNGYPIWQITFREDVKLRIADVGVGEVGGVIVEFADTQSESFPDPESRQRISIFGSIDEDIARRDFTCNMLLRNISSNEIIDKVGGIEDIKNGILRGHPNGDMNKTFSDDALRMLRCARFAGKYNFKVDHSVFKAMHDNAERINIISNERISDELIKLMEIGKLHGALKVLDGCGILKHIMPEVVAMQGVFHDLNAPYHRECGGDVFGHVMLVLAEAKPGVVNQLSALFHDIGKPKARKVNEETGKVSFKAHEPIGAIMVKDILKRMKFDNKTVELVSKLVMMHTRPHQFGKWGEGSIKALRKLIRDAGDDMEMLLNLSEADCLGNHPVLNNVPELRESIARAIAEIPVIVKPILSGREIMDIRGMKKGSSIIKDIMEAIVESTDELAEIGKAMTISRANVIAKNFKG
jgi:poly(A) polymerase